VPPAFPIVGVGASAGGLDALTELVAELEAGTPVALVVVQHLDPSHKSALADMLSRTTALPVVEARDGMRAEPAHVYVIAENASMTIVRGILRVAPRERSGHMTIDHFFRSLAEDCGGRAIGVVLSGNAPDGALGVAAIKAAGGITFAQEPQTARYAGMPRNAVASGAVDFVLPPKEIARELTRLARAPYVHGDTGAVPAAESGDGGRRALEGILGIVQRARGVDFTHYRQTTIRRRIGRRMLVHRIETVEAYHRYLLEHPQEVPALFNDLLITVTRFFRDESAFRYLQRRVLPRIMKRRAEPAGIRVWVPACATGEEAYSLAILLIESLGAEADRVPIQIFGTDVSDAAVAKARAGVYLSNIELDVSPERLRRFFVRQDGQYRVTKSLRERCVFARHDLAKDPPFSNVDLVSCRNVLIYLEPLLQQRVMSVLHYALRNEGFLLLGESETLGPHGDLFATVDRKHKVYAKKPAPRRLPSSIAGPDALSRRADAASGPPAVASPAGLRDTLPREVDRVLLTRYAPAAVVVNDDLEIVQFRGRTSPFLEPAAGQASFNLLKMAREGLLLPLRETIARVRKLGARVRREKVRVRQNGTFVQIDLDVLPLTVPPGERHYVVVFEEVRASRTQRPGLALRGRPTARDAHPRQQLEAMRRELAATKEFLQSLVAERDRANDELRVAHEEVLSSNEELQSTNEELETAKEELVSSNEELTTLNDELRHRNVELSLLSGDLGNLFSSTNLPIMMFDRDLRLRRFTAAAAAVFDLGPADVGRSVRDVRASVECPELAEFCRRAVTQAQSADDHQIRDRGGRWYTLRVRPYRDTDNRVEGCVVVFSDITELKTSVEAAGAAYHFAQSIVDTVREPLVVVDDAQRVVSVSRSFSETFPPTSEQERIEGRLLHEADAGRWAALLPVLHDVSERNASVEGVEIALDVPGLGERTFLVNARRIRARADDPGLTLVAMQDATARKQMDVHIEAGRTAAENANRAKDEFVALVAHELRTPLGAVLGWVRLLKGGTLDAARTAQGVDIIARNARILARLIDDLLDVSRMRTGTLGLEHTLVDLGQVITAAVDAVRSAADVKSVRFDVRLGEVRRLVTGDRDRLEQIVLNLLTNAVKFGATVVEVALTWTDHGARIVVRDDGKGIAPALLPHVFDRFRQGQSGRDKAYGGLGLGLAIVQHLVERHGGAIRAESPGEGRGATFTVDLPSEGVASGEPIADVWSGRASADSEGPVRLDGLRVLVVEDDPDTSDLLVVLLQQYGADVEAAASAKEAFEAFVRRRPDVLISDIGLPGEDGYALVGRVRSLSPERGGEVPAIAVTALAGGEAQDRSIAAGYQYHMAKPVDPARLVALVDHLTHGAARRRSTSS
jgi:two-component system CheB/CheR fusion protein